MPSADETDSLAGTEVDGSTLQQMSGEAAKNGPVQLAY